jgi:hypothetical protein
MMTIGGGASYALFGRHASHKTVSASAMDAPRVDTARMFAAPIAPPEPDLIAAKLAPPPIIWPETPKPEVKGKRPETVQTDAAKPAGTKKARAKTVGTKSASAPKPTPKPKQAALNAATSR